MAGKTKAGSPPVQLDGFFMFDQVLQLVRSIDWALMMDSHEDKPPNYPQRMDYIANRAFLQGMRDIFLEALEDQHPDLLKKYYP